tara:strand:+ start:143 stop:718 length:576 start_codon:yes stop_codon:yes gene_type:complete
MNENDNELVSYIQQNKNTNACLQELINRHSGIFYDMVNKLVPNQSPVCNKNDILNERDYHIYNSALKFDPDKGTKFSTFLGNETRWLCLNSYNKEKRRKIDFKTVEEINSVNNLSKEEEIDMHLLNEILFIIDKHPDSRVSRIFKMRYQDGHNYKLLPWKKIAPHVNLSIQGCINVHDGVIKEIKRKLLKK